MEGGIHLTGDGRCDSPGHSAKYGGYTVIEQRINKVLDTQLVQSNEVTSSNACELEGLKRCLTLLTETHELDVASMVTDRHKSIAKYLREETPHNPHTAELKHHFDAWHIAKGSKPGELLNDILTNPHVLKDIKKISSTYQTSSLEAFHSLIIRFAPKHTGFMWLCQLARYYLAALHYNENSARLQAVTREGQERFTISFPKFKKGQHSVRKEKTPAKYKYTTNILEDLLQAYSDSPQNLRESIQEVRNQEPQPLASEMDHPDKDEAVRRHRCRFINQ
ncbi:uncharacterized protein [Notothenia coriiceps]|uniref:Uncharacterized protein LOC104943939 n=1 Tax=Notothenia coriiceps TaxID=8208 RepID=A0A6I9N0D9_9TELE|nr:PREDICTED: uncharacterized protein LOC104943939 [Notothenia coriiceps]XP_010767711.1 PREDICTED: uncharacterized protein LOC104943939 [Notothenia coriiceps]